MSICFLGFKQFHTADMSVPYFPFGGECDLPECSICVSKKADGELKFAKSAFLHYLYSFDSGNSVNVGDYSFAPCGDGVAIRDKNAVRTWVHDNFHTIDTVVFCDNLSQQIIDQHIMQAFRYTMLASGGLLVHSASVFYKNKAILFCGIPGAGKSTQARLWNSVMNAPSLNNDQTAVFRKDGVYIAHGTPWSGKEPCFVNRGYPLEAIVFVTKSPVDRVERLRPAEAYGLLYMNNFVVPVQDGIEDDYSAVVEDIAKSIPVYRQYCTITEEAPKTLLKALCFD